MVSPSISYVRKYIQDFPLKNVKYDDQIFDDEDIDTAIKAAEQEANTIPPTTIGHGQLPAYVMLLGTISQLFFQRFLNKTLNFAPGIQENGIAIPVGEEASVLKGVYDELHSQFITMVRQIKQAITIEESMTQIPSPYDRFRS